MVIRLIIPEGQMGLSLQKTLSDVCSSGEVWQPIQANNFLFLQGRRDSDWRIFLITPLSLAMFTHPSVTFYFSAGCDPYSG